MEPTYNVIKILCFGYLLGYWEKFCDGETRGAHVEYMTLIFFINSLAWGASVVTYLVICSTLLNNLSQKATFLF